MIALSCLFFVVAVQYTSAQAIPYGMSNRGTPNGLAMGRGIANGIGRNIPIAGNNMAREHIINRHNLADPYYANNLVYANQKMANPTLANIVETNLANPIISGNRVLANDITAATLENLASANIMPNVVTPTVIANMPKVTAYNFGNSPIPVTVTGRSHGNHHVGINIAADNLEVNGLVNVVGRMPIFGAVTLNGNVPSDGKASANYSCGSLGAV